MVRIRLQRFGKKKNPFFRIVVAPNTAPRDGYFIEVLGTYDPKKKEFKIDLQKYEEWVKKGAQPTDIVRSLIKNFSK